MSRYLDPHTGRSRAVFNASDSLLALRVLADSRRGLARSCRTLDGVARDSVREAIQRVRETIRDESQKAAAEGVDPVSIANWMSIPDRLRGVLVEWGTHTTCDHCDGRGAVIVGDSDERCTKCAGTGSIARAWFAEMGGV